MKAYISTICLPGTLVKGSNPLPIFRDPIKDKPSKSDGTLNAEELYKLGDETGYRVLPYRLYDKYDRDKRMIQLKTVVLENDRIRVEFLPEHGGRLYSMINKSTGNDVFLRNPVYQPCNLGILDAWFSGGVEWNVAQYGHTFTSNLPVFFARVKKGDYEFLRMYDYERCKGMFYHIDFHLPDGSDVLYAYICMINDDSQNKPTYWWTNAAIPQNRNVRVFSCTDEVMFLRPESIGNNVNPVRIFGHAKLPILPTLPDFDSTYPENSNYSNEFFFQNPKTEKAPWSAAAYNDGTLYFDRSTQPLRFRKMFCWGNHRGGQRWCDYLSVPGDASHYIELQAGLTPTQLNGLEIPGNTRWAYTQAFGTTKFDDLNAPYSQDWLKSRDYVASCIAQALPEDTLLKNHERFAELALLPVLQVLSQGSGWGALECIRRKAEGRNVPENLLFPESSISDEQLPWLHLLENGSLPPQGPLDTPLSWMIDENWMMLLEKSLKKEDNATARLHLGVMKYENFKFDAGIADWKESLLREENPWAIRNLAVAADRAGNLPEALRLMERAVEIEDNRIDKAFTEEYFDLLIRAGQFSKLWELFEALPEDRKHADRILIQAGYAAVELDNMPFVEKLTHKEFACIREGDNLLVDMWFKYAAKQEAKARQVPYSEALYKEVRKTQLPPSTFDFRMVDN